MSTEFRCFPPAVVATRRATLTPIRRDMLQIRLFFRKASQFFRWIGGFPVEVIGGDIKCVATRSFMVPVPNVKLLSRRHIWTEVMAYHLSKMGVPRDEQPAIIGKIFEAVDVAVDPEMAILVDIKELTRHYLELGSESESDHNIWIMRERGNIIACGRIMGESLDNYIIGRAMRESFYRYRANLIPASKSSIEGLEQVRLDSLEEEAIIGQAPLCVICMEGLDHHFDTNANAAAAEDEDDHDHDQDQGVDQPMIITRLPCSHHFHRHCIVRWLEISHLCPLCRYPMPIVKEGEPSEPKRDYHERPAALLNWNNA